MKRFKKQPVAIFRIVLLFLISVSTLYGEGEDFRLSLTGEWEMVRTESHQLPPKMGEGLNWTRVVLPSHNLISDVRSGYLLLRKRFSLQEKPSEPLLLQIREVMSADRLFLNGELVGSGGRFPPRFRSGWSDFRSYKISPVLLKQGENQILIQVYYDAELWVRGPIELIDLERGGLRKLWHDFLLIHLLQALSFLLLFIASFFIIFFFKRREEYSYLYFALASISAALAVALQFLENLYGALPLSSNDVFRVTQIALLFLPVWISLFFQHYVFQKVGRVRFFLSLGVPLVGSLLMLFAETRPDIMFWRNHFLIGACLLFGDLVFQAVRLLIRGNSKALPMILALLPMVVLGLYDIAAFALHWIDSGIALFIYGLPVLLIMLSAHLTNRFVKSLNRTEELNEELNRMVDSVRELNTGLEEKVHERTGELERANLRLKNMDEVKNRLFTNISHELRTPLTLILAPLETLMSDRKNLDPEQLESLDHIRKNGQLLLKLINDLLDLAKFDAGKMNLSCERIDIRKFVGDISRHFEPIAGSKGLNFEYPEGEPLDLFGDPEKLEKVVLNLLSNAFKFTRAGGVQVLVEESGDFAKVVVSDSGIGIEESDQELVFERFRQIDSNISRKYEGTGVGLALSREIVALHKGRVELASKTGSGSVFTIHLPLRRAEALAAVVEQGTHKSAGPFNYAESIIAEQYNGVPVEGEGKNPELSVVPARAEKPAILIVEDNAGMRKYLGEILREEYRIFEADNGRTGLEQAEKILPDVILSDVMMPEVNGLSLLRQVKFDEKLRMIPFVFLTAKSDIVDRLEGLRYGADAYIAKPFRPAELKLRIRNLLHRVSLFELSLSKEREKIYTNLHDYLGGNLTDLTMLTERFKGENYAQNHLIGELERNVLELARSYKQCFLEVEDLNILKEDFLDGLQLVLLRRYSNFEREFEFHAEDDVKDVFFDHHNDELKQALYSVCLEIATNDLKYGNGVAVWKLTPFISDGQLELYMKSGSIYDLETQAPGHGTGNIKKRIEDVGGTVETRIESSTYYFRARVPVAG